MNNTIKVDLWTSDVHIVVNQHRKLINWGLTYILENNNINCMRNEEEPKDKGGCCGECC